MPRVFKFDGSEEYLNNYERWYANISPSEIRKLKGRKIIWVDYVDPYRGTFVPKVNIIADAHRSFIIFENGTNIDKRCIIDSGILKLKT